MTTTIRQLVLYTEVDDTWEQLLDGPGGSVYVIPTGGQGMAKSIHVLNLDPAHAVTFEMAVSTDSTIDAEEFAFTIITIPPGGQLIMDDTGILAMRDGEGLWMRVVDGDDSLPFVTVRAAVLEVVP